MQSQNVFRRLAIGIRSPVLRAVSESRPEHRLEFRNAAQFATTGAEGEGIGAIHEEERMTTPIRIKATDQHDNVAYIHREAGAAFRCTLANGTPASFFYAGVSGDETACRFALEACSTGEDALAVMRRYGSPLYSYSFIGPVVHMGSARRLTALAALEAEVQRLKALVPAVAELIDNRAVDQARAAIARVAPDGADIGLYLHLFHGRRDPSDNLDEWGIEGPTIGPLASLHVTFMCDISFATAPEVMERYFPAVIADWQARGLANADGPLCEWNFPIVDDLVAYDGVYYGDWAVFLADPSEIERKGPPAPKTNDALSPACHSGQIHD